MNQLKSLIRISELLSRFKIQICLLNANSQFDINIVSEDVLIPILNIAYNCNLSNANYSEDDKQFPALDLLDKENRIAFQITSTPTMNKVKKTIGGIIKNNFHAQFDNFYIYIITCKQSSYDKGILKTITGELFIFTEKNIIDNTDLYLKIASLPFIEILKVEKLLEKQFSDIIKDESEIQKNIEKTITKVKVSHQEQFLIAEIEGAYEARKGWLIKKIFFEKKLPSISDTNQQYSIYIQIEEINERISFYNDIISNLLNLISI